MNQQANLIIQDLSWKPMKQHPPILQEISETLQAGEFYGILGPNGSGKTSLIRHLLRTLPAESGRIALEEKELASYSRKELARKVSFVPQNTNIDTGFSVYDIVAMGRTPYLKKFTALRQEDREAIREAMAITDCEKLKDKLFSNLSGGEKQRALIARAIAQDTPWMILDEPIASLDIKHQIGVMETLKMRNQASGCTVIAILHDLNLAAAYCSKIVLMKQGKIFAAGDVKDVLTPKNLQEVYEIEFQVLWDEQEERSYFIPKR